jgi:hypothetical protein
MHPVNLDKLVPIAKKAFNHAAKEKRKAMVTPQRGKTPTANRTLNLDTVAGAEFYVWNEANPLVLTRNSGDPWYKNFFEAHTEVDTFTAQATQILTVKKE